MNRILITGSKGFIGSYLVRHLDGYELTELPVRLEEDIEQYFKDQDFVIHLAAKLPRHKAEGLYNEVNVQGTEKVARLSLKYGCKLINFSSHGVHDKNSEYGKSKLEAEKIVEKYVKEGLRAVTIRPSTIYDDSFLSVFKDGEWYPIKKLFNKIRGLLNDEFINYFRYRIIELKEDHNKYKFAKRIVYRVLRKIQKCITQNSQ